MKYKVLCTLCFVLFLRGGADGAGAGTTGANLLKVGVGPRVLAMGDATAALPGDLSAIAANPALLSAIGSRAFMAMYWPGAGGLRTEYVSYSPSLRWLGVSRGQAALTVLYRTLPDIDNVADWPRAAPVPGEAPVAVNDGMLMISAGHPVGEAGGHAGVNVKVFNSALGETRATSFAIDAGALLRVTGVKDMHYGVSVLNLGSPIKHESAGEWLPLAVRGGLSWQRPIYPHRLSLAADATVNIEQDIRGGAGIEWLQAGRLALRAGGSAGRYRAASFGVGAGWRLRSTLLGPEAEYHFDYAYLPFAFLAGHEPTHAFSIYVRF